MASVEIAVVVEPGETVEDAAAFVAKGTGASWEVVSTTSGEGGWPIVRFSGNERALRHVHQRYETAGRPRPDLQGKPSVRKGEKR